MAWFEASNVDFVFGLAKNKRRLKMSLKPRLRAQQAFLDRAKAARVFDEAP